MKLLILLSLSSFLALNVWAQPSPCVSPPLLVGSIAAIDPVGNLETIGQYSYDALQEIVHITTYGSYKEKSLEINLLIQFKQGVAYEINYLSNSCKKYALKSTFQPLRVPANATFLSEVILGTTSIPGMGLPITIWKGFCPELNANYILTFTQFTCLPVSADIFTQDAGTIVLSFYNQLLGIQNPMNLFPPSFCETTSEEADSLPKTDFFSAINDLTKNYRASEISK